MEKTERPVMTFYNPDVPKYKDYRKYQRPTLPTKGHMGDSMTPQLQKHLVEETQIYLRMFSGSLCGFSLLLMILTAPMDWVNFLVIKSGIELSAGLWATCNNEVCWSHLPKPPYQFYVQGHCATGANYLQYARGAFIICLITVFLYFGWLFSSCLPRRGGGMIANLDLKVSLLSFIAAISLLFCLILFHEHIRWHTKDIMESGFTWTYYLNWWNDFLYFSAGVIAFLNFMRTKSLPIDHDDEKDVVPAEKSRLGIGPVTTASPVDKEERSSEMGASSEEKEEDTESSTV